MGPIGIVRAMLAAALVAGLAACSGGHPTRASGSPAQAASLARTSPCGHRGTPPRRYAHVIWIVMENKSAASALDPALAPYTARVARQCGLATRYTAVAHPSLPNYIALTSGSTQGIHDDGGPEVHHLAARSIFGETGGSWRALEESMPSRCLHVNAGGYAVRHDPAVYYTPIAAACTSHVVPLRRPPVLSARFTFVTPNIRSDTHDAPVSVGDAWLSHFLRAVFRSPQYRSGTTAVFVTWDEDDSAHGNHVALLAMAPTIPAGTRVHAPANHYSLLRTTQELLGLSPPLGNAAHAHSLRAAFHL